jgi:thiol-disulfide isomerase/thioredoxin
MNSFWFRILSGLVLLAGVYFWYQHRLPRFGAGEQAPDFQATLADGKTARLSDLKGKYVLLQFWGSWCGPCRAENPHLADLYRQYRDKGFEIFSVGVEQNPNAWQRAVKNDGMVWPYHTVDFQEFGGELAQLYNIKSIPATFLINPEGAIVGVNWRPGQIEKALAERLAK